MSWLLAYTIIEWIIRVVMVPVILGRHRNPTASLAWLSLIFFLPVVGLVLYLTLGVSHLGRRRRVRSHQRLMGKRSAHRIGERRNYALRPELEPVQQNMIRQAEQISGNSIVGGNTIDLLTTTQDFISRLVEDIDAARHHAHLLYYIFRPDTTGRRITDALIRAAQRGVSCRLLVDSAGSRSFFRSASFRDLIAAGVRVHAMLPVAPWRRRLSRIDLRNHRKIAVIDGNFAYVGSHNIVVENYGNLWAGKWIDLSGRFTGPVVAQLQQTFLDDWAFTTGESLDHEDLFPAPSMTGTIAAQVVPTGPNYEHESFRRVLVAALNAANKRIVITTPYLVLDEPTMLALWMAADRGAQVTIITPKRSDHPIVAAAGHWYYEQLLEGGISIYQYRGGMLHAKTITVDESFALLGSANMDIRSFELNFEINVLLYGKDVTNLLYAAQQGYLENCTPIDLEQWKQRPTLQKYLDSAAALLSPLL